MALESEASGITAEESRTSVLYRGCALRSGPSDVSAILRSAVLEAQREAEKQATVQTTHDYATRRYRAIWLHAPAILKAEAQ